MLNEIYWKFEEPTLYLRKSNSTGYNKYNNTGGTPPWYVYSHGDMYEEYITEVVIEEELDIDSISNWFYYCVRLTTIQGWENIPNSVIYMNNCFSLCYSFNQPITIPSSVEEMNSCFSDCTSFNSLVTFESNSTLKNMNSCFYGCSSFNQPIAIPSSVIYMDNCFSDCILFNQPITIPSGVRRLGECFSNCNAFNQSVTIPSTALELQACFYNCYSLTGIIEINASISNSRYYLELFANTSQEIILCRSIGSSSPTVQKLQAYASTSTNNNVKIGKLTSTLRAERDENDDTNVKVTISINRFRLGESLLSLELYKNDNTEPETVTWTPSSLLIDSANKTFETTLYNIDETSVLNIRVRATDEYSFIDREIRVGKSYHTIDLLAGGREIAFGVSAKEDDLYNKLSEIPVDFNTNYNDYYMKVDGNFIPYTSPSGSTEEIVNNIYEKIHDSLFKCSMDANFYEPVAFGKISETFVVTTESFSYSAISNGSSSGAKSVTFSPTYAQGYYPIGIMGLRTGSSAAVPARFNLKSRASGSVTFTYVLRAVGGNVSAGSGDVDILWIKEI